MIAISLKVATKENPFITNNHYPASSAKSDNRHYFLAHFMNVMNKILQKNEGKNSLSFNLLLS